MRLLLLSTSLLSLSLSAPLGCGGGGGDGAEKPKPAAPAGRVAAVAPKKAKPVDVKEFCEPWTEAADAKAFSYPGLSSGEGVAGKRRWVNVWATWCAPCIEELPRLKKWKDDLAKDGVATDLVLLSVDGDAEAVSAFAQKHPEVDGTLEIENAELMGPWLESLGLSESSVLPIHFFVDADDEIRCVRMAGVSETDYEAVKQVLQQI
jgi:thiol-disulfide isomerase/thioredoxin